MLKTNKLIVLYLILFPAVLIAQKKRDLSKPNVIILYFDDMGFGDMGKNLPTQAKIPAGSKYLDPSRPTLTPNLDGIAGQGMRFTNGHSADAVCSPSRYAIMTGRYAWRTSLKKGVVGGYSKTFMPKDQFTIANMFKSLNYQTAMVGKWHIGMQFYSPDGKPVDLANDPKVLEGNKIDFSKPLDDTPFHCGFDYYFGTASSLDMPPYAWIESRDGKVRVLAEGAGVKEGKVDFSQARFATNKDLKEGKGVPNVRPGVYDPNFKAEDYLQIQAQKVIDLVQKWDAEEKPFFIYVPIPAPHDPHAVQEQFKGSAGFNYGDYIVQTDYYAGKIIEALGNPDNPASIASNTVLFISSDNGPETHSYVEGQKNNHDANGPYKGIKRDNWEGGTRVPFLVRWPGVVEAGTSTDQLVWQGDFMVSMADYLGYKLNPVKEAPDAISFLPVLRGKPITNPRLAFIEHSSQGQFAIVDPKGEWKLIDGTGGGGNAQSFDGDNKKIENAKGELFKLPRQLYNLKVDPGERNNLLVNNPGNPNSDTGPPPSILAKEKELYDLLNQIRGDDGPGSASKKKK